MLATPQPQPVPKYKHVTLVDYSYDIPARVTIDGVEQERWYFHCTVPAKVNGKVNLAGLRTCVLFQAPIL